MLAEFLTKLQAIVEENRAVRFHATPVFPREVLVQSGGLAEWRPAPAPLRRPRLHALEDLLAMATDPAAAPRPQVYVDHTTVELLLDRDDRREVACLPLVPTDRWGLIEKMDRQGWTGTPAEAVHLIRFQLHGLGHATDALCSALSKIDFKRTNAGASVTQHGRESLGRQVEASVQQADDVPKTVVANVPVFRTRGLRDVEVQVEIGVRLLPTEEKVSLVPLYDEVADARERAAAAVVEILRRGLDEPGVPVYRGTSGHVGTA